MEWLGPSKFVGVGCLVERHDVRPSNARIEGTARWVSATFQILEEGQEEHLLCQLLQSGWPPQYTTETLDGEPLQCEGLVV